MTRHGQLVGDWVEVFRAGRLRAEDGRRTLRIGFRAFGAAGFQRGRPRLWRLEAFPDASQANWETFLGALGGAPPRVACDNHFGRNGAVGATFPEAEL